MIDWTPVTDVDITPNSLVRVVGITSGAALINLTTNTAMQLAMPLSLIATKITNDNEKSVIIQIPASP